MQYDNYEKKIRKITKILRILYRNKIKIALAIVVLTTSTVLMMAAISGLLAMKGTIISSSDSYSDEIIYGEELDYSAKAFLAKVSYEYRADGSDEWSAEFPKDPGKYFVRAVAKAAVGNRYGEEKSFTLSPKPINVTISDPLVIYGEAPVLAAELVGSDMISSADFVYNEERSIAEADGDTVLIVDYLGNDITSRYVISTEERQIATAQRPITLSVVSSTKEYDGRPLVGEKVDISEKGIADGDKPKFTFIGSSITDVGETLNDVECRIFNSKGEDVTEYYRIKTNVGKLTVTPRKIKVRSSSMEPRIYDSTTYSVKKYTLWGTVAEGHEILTRRWASLTDAGKVENTFYCSINNEEGRDVTSNYDIEYEYGTLEILRRPLSVKTLDLPSTYYDGKSHSYQKYNVTGEYNVVYGQSLKCTSYASVTKAGDNNAVDNKLTLTVVDSYGRDISGNYDISYEYGKLALQKRPITVTPREASRTYNGSAQSSTVIDITGEGLAPNQQYSVTDFTKFTDVLKDNNGQVVAQANKLKIVIKANNGYGADVTENYEITYVDGKFTMIPRALRITTSGISVVYDGEAHKTHEYSAIGFVSGHKLSVTEATTLTDASKKANEFTKFEIQDRSGNVISKDNYNITWTHGYVEVTKRPITFVTASVNTYYSDSEITAKTIAEASGSLKLVKGHTLTGLTVTGKGIIPGTYNNTYTGTADILDANNKSVWNNYSVTIRIGQIVINNRPINVVSGSYNEYYDGEAHTIMNLSTKVDGQYLDLCEGHIFEITSSSAYKDVINGQRNIVGFRIRGKLQADGTRPDVTKYYSTTRTYGTITIRPRPVLITTNAILLTYDGMYHSDDSIEASPYNNEGGLCLNIGGIRGNDHTIIVNGAPEFKNAVDNTTNNVDYTILDENGRDVTKNYDPHEDFGFVTIKKRPIVFMSDDYTGIYDGISHTERNNLSYSITTSDSGLCVIGIARHYVDIDTSTWTVIKNHIVNGENDVSFVIRDEFGDIVWDGEGPSHDNYEVTFIRGKINISKRPIIVTTIDYTGVYDGLPHTDKILYPEVTVEGRGLCVTPNGKHGFVVDDLSWAELRNAVDDGRHTVDFYICDENGRNVSSNYELDFRPGVVNIAKRRVVVETGSKTWVYDALPHFCLDYKCVEGTSFVDFHDVTPVNPTIITNVGTAINEFGFTVTVGGEDVIANYEISLSDNKGILEIVPRPITIVSGSDEKYYDGTPLIYEGIDSADGLIEKHMITEITFTGSITWLGTAENTFDTKSVVILDENRVNVTSNYVIVPQYGTLTVKGQIQVTPAEQTKVYDGTPLYPDPEKYEPNLFLQELLKLGYTVEMSMEGSQTTVGEGTSIITRFELKDTEGNVIVLYENGEYLVDEYVCEFGDGILKVIRPDDIVVEVYILPKIREYDGALHEIFMYECIKLSVPSGIDFQLLELKNLSLRNVMYDEFDNVIGISSADINANIDEYFTFTVTKDGLDYSDFCGIKVVNILDRDSDYDVLSIIPREITITTGSATQSYDENEPLVFHQYEITKGTLVEGEEIAYLEITGKATEKGVAVENIVRVDSLVIENTNGEDVTTNYAVQFIPGILKAV